MVDMEMFKGHNKSASGFESFEEVRCIGDEIRKDVVTSDVHDHSNQVDNLLQTVIAYMKQRNIPANRISQCIDFFIECKEKDYSFDLFMVESQFNWSFFTLFYKECFRQYIGEKMSNSWRKSKIAVNSIINKCFGTGLRFDGYSIVAKDNRTIMVVTLINSSLKDSTKISDIFKYADKLMLCSNYKSEITLYKKSNNTRCYMFLENANYEMIINWPVKLESNHTVICKMIINVDKNGINKISSAYVNNQPAKDMKEILQLAEYNEELYINDLIFSDSLKSFLDCMNIKSSESLINCDTKNLDNAPSSHFDTLVDLQQYSSNPYNRVT